MPVLDLTELALGRPAARLLSTRLVLVRYPDGTGERKLLGLLAEGATESLCLKPADFAPTGIRSEDAPWLGPMAADASGLIQRIDIETLLPNSLRALVFPQAHSAQRA